MDKEIERLRALIKKHEKCGQHDTAAHQRLAELLAIKKEQRKPVKPAYTREAEETKEI